MFWLRVDRRAVSGIEPLALQHRVQDGRPSDPWIVEQQVTVPTDAATDHLESLCLIHRQAGEGHARIRGARPVYIRPQRRAGIGARAGDAVPVPGADVRVEA